MNIAIYPLFYTVFLSCSVLFLWMVGCAVYAVKRGSPLFAVLYWILATIFASVVTTLALLFIIARGAL